jgi:uncharacterized protein (TIRG00374 family)
VREEPRTLVQRALHRLTIGRVLLIVVATVGFYVVAPGLLKVFSSWPELTGVAPWWLGIVVGCEAASFACAITLQRVALRTRRWFAVATSQLSANALSQSVPGGAAAGAALQLRLLTRAGVQTDIALSGFTAFSLLQTASLFLLPLLALPTILGGAPVNRGLAQSAIVGAVGFIAIAILGTLLLITDRPLAEIGRFTQSLHNRLLRKREPLANLPERFLKERDAVRSALGEHWWQAALATAGRLGFDYLALLSALTAIGSRPRPSLVLLAYASAMVLSMIPITPGGLGLVETGLTATLVLAGVSGGDAVLATLIYRLASYWLPIVAGPFAYGLYRLRYRNETGRPAT